jgi:putative transposase
MIRALDAGMLRGLVMLYGPLQELDMAFSIRIQNPKIITFVSNRCIDELFLLKPCPRVNALILGCLARAVAKYGIELIGYVFMGNHYHLILRAPHGNLGAFMRDFQAWLARKLKKIRKKISGSVFPQRYRQVDILDDAKAFEKLIYLLANPCAAHLVASPQEYPGLSSLPYHLSGGKIVGRWVDEERFNRNRKRNPKYPQEKAATYHEIELTPLPQMAGWTQQRRALTILRALEGRCESLEVERGKKRVVGVKGLEKLDPYSRPRSPKKSTCARAVCTDPEKIGLYEEHRARVIESYYKSRKKAQDPKRKTPVKYPPGTSPPGIAMSTPYAAKDLEEQRLGSILGSEAETASGYRAAG